MLLQNPYVINERVYPFYKTRPLLMDGFYPFLQNPDTKFYKIKSSGGTNFHII